MNPDGPGVRCEWEHTRWLHLCRVNPLAGRWLMARALRDWPQAWREMPLEEPPTGDGVRQLVSFILPHRGRERLPLLRNTLRSLAGQAGAAVECIVVENDERPSIGPELPEWVRYVHAPPRAPGDAFSRALAFNAGARVARGDLLVLHDGDLPAPAAYAREVRAAAETGAEVIQLKRFIFYLSETDSWRVAERGGRVTGLTPEGVLENACAGGSLAVRREAFIRVGGMDPDFKGWGGEDVEFWDRCRTLRVWAFGYLPFLHLWHRPQDEKHGSANHGPALAEIKMSQPRDERIARRRAAWETEA